MSDKLLSAIYQNNADLLSEVHKLLDEGENPNTITSYGESALRVASNNGRFDVIQLLLSRGADERQLGWTPLFHVIAFGNIDNLTEALTDQSNLEARDFWQRTPLLLSILNGDINKTALLIKSGANITAVGRCGKTPLAYAIQHDDVTMLKWLIENGFNPEQQDDFLTTPLIEAAEHGATQCAVALVNAGVDIYKQNHIPEMAISVAVNLDIIYALTNAGADINEINKESRATLLGYRVDEYPDTTKEEYLKNQISCFWTIQS